MNLKEDLQSWTEIEDVLLILGKRLGVYPLELQLKDFPKYVLWSTSEDAKEIESLNTILQELVALGVLLERDGAFDYELKWNTHYNIGWEEKKHEN